ncbi:hypothetical protein ACIGW3_26235 [Streptomyces sp. NPDC053499]|uniref:hypothetical protein n=1 Tax=Streptomyces sp. NPDC053499 TaxID=3365707 RepID=UPI0037D1B123
MARIIVEPPDAEGARRVRADSRILGRATNVFDVLALTETVGLDPATVRLDDAALIDWRGGGAYDWEPRETGA